jgi:putative ABC transport system permease protein
MFNQIGQLLRMGLRTLPQRLGTSAVIVIGIAGVVGVLVSVLACGAGLTRTLVGTGRNDVAIVLSSGSQSEAGSSLSQADYDTVVDGPGVAHDQLAKPLVSPEILTVLPVAFRESATEASVALRGVGPQGLAIHSSIQITDGRVFRPGVRELIVGAGVARQFSGFATGDIVRVGNSSWTVTGHFTSHDIHDSEVLADVAAVQSVTGMSGYYNVVYAQLESAARFGDFKTAIAGKRGLHLDALTEPQYFASQSKDMLETIAVLATVIGFIMAIGAVFGAMQSLYICADSRRTEMATLRAIGFTTHTVILSFLLEALLLSLLGGLIGAAVAWLFFNGHTASAFSGQGQLEFQLHVSPALVATGVTWACTIGLLGALLPTIRAARQPIATALRT